MHLGSHIVAKFILSSLFLILVKGGIEDFFPRVDPRRGGTEEDARLNRIFRSTFLGRDFQKKDSEALPPEPEEHSLEPLQPDHEKRLFEPNDFTEAKSLQIWKTWREKRDQILSIDEDFSRVFELMRATEKVRSKSYSRASNATLAERRKTLSQVTRVLKTIVKKLYNFEHWKFIELIKDDLPVSKNKILAHLLKGYDLSQPGVEKLPPELVEHIADLAWKYRGQSVVDELKQLIHDHHLFSDGPWMDNFFFELELQEWWEKALRTVDVLYMHHFVEQPIIRSFFQSAESIKQLVIHARRMIYQAVGRSPIYMAGNLFTKHWYWPHIHQFFEALDSEQRSLIDGYFFLGFRHDQLIESDAPSTLYHDFLSTFTSKQYLPFLTLMKDQPNHLQALADEHTQEIIGFLRTHIGEYKSSDSDKEIIQHLCYILEFLEPYKSSAKVEDGALENEIQFHKLDAKVQGFNLQAASFSYFEKQQFNKRRLTSHSLKEEFQKHLSEAKYFLQQLNSCRRTENTPDLINFASTMEDLVKQMESNFKKFFPDAVDTSASICEIMGSTTQAKSN